MSVTVPGYMSIAASLPTALKGYNCNLLRLVHGMLRQAPKRTSRKSETSKPPTLRPFADLHTFACLQPRQTGIAQTSSDSTRADHRVDSLTNHSASRNDDIVRLLSDPFDWPPRPTISPADKHAVGR